MLLKNQDFIDRSSHEDSIDKFVRKDKKIRTVGLPMMNLMQQKHYL